jgi:hypothetical protein
MKPTQTQLRQSERQQKQQLLQEKIRHYEYQLSIDEDATNDTTPQLQQNYDTMEEKNRTIETEHVVTVRQQITERTERKVQLEKKLEQITKTITVLKKENMKLRGKETKTKGKSSDVNDLGSKVNTTYQTLSEVQDELLESPDD